MSDMNVGIFEVSKVSTGKWKVVNTLTTFEHVTYGDEADVRTQLEKQSADWERRVAAKAAKKKAGKLPEPRTLAPMKRNPFIESRESTNKKP